MKKSVFIAFLALFLSAASPAFSSSIPVRDSAETEKVVSGILSRITEIQKMDKSNMSRAEKKALKKELREMKKTMRGLDSRVSISIGAIIIIVLLLILLL